MAETLLEPRRPPTRTATRERARPVAPSWLARNAPLVAVLAVAAILDTWALGQNGYANIYYSAGVKSMLESWHNFLFVSADPAGLITIDKPPLGLWLQASSAWVFGFSPLSLLLPEALAGIASVGVVYVVVRKRCGTFAALASSLALALFPSFVAISRDNNLDALLILLMVLACATALRAIESGRLRTLIGAGVLVGLAFNTKTLAACLVVPGIALGYLWCAPGTPRRRLAHVLVAGAVCAAISLSWIALVELTPASRRPFVGSTKDNSELSLTFTYNGFGRLGGEENGPGPVPDLEVTPSSGASPGRRRGRGRRHAATAATGLPRPSPDSAPALAATIERSPISFVTPPGPLRLFRDGFGDQSAWLLLLALAGLAALGLSRPRRREPRLAVLIVFGGFFLCEALFLSVSRGIVHPYYVSALGPGLAVMAGVGLATMASSRRPAQRRLLVAAALATAVVEILLLHHNHFMRPWQLLLLPLTAAALLILPRSRGARRAGLASLLAILLVAPAAYSATTWREPVQGTFPLAGPRAVEGNGGVGLSRGQLATMDALMRYVIAHRAGSRYQLLTEASLTADSAILLGLRAAAVGGYGGIDPALDGPGLARLLAAGEARYVLIGDSYSYLGGNAAVRAAAAVCPEVPLAAWRGARARASNGLYLVDCRGRAAELAAYGDPR